MNNKCNINTNTNTENKLLAKQYVDFSKFRIKWKDLYNDLLKYCLDNYSDIKNVQMTETEGDLALSRKLTFFINNVQVKDYYVAIDINGENVNFLFCIYPDFEHCTAVDNIEELVEVIWGNIMY